MSATNEWFIMHLTPEGWENGSRREDFVRETNLPDPPDRVLTIRFREYQSCSFAETDRSREEVWRSPDQAAVKLLTEKYGSCPADYRHWPERTGR